MLVTVFCLGMRTAVSSLWLRNLVRPRRLNRPYCVVQVETLARQMLKNPIEIQVGGRSVVNSDITQARYPHA